MPCKSARLHGFFIYTNTIMTAKKRTRIDKVIKSVVAGKTVTQAGIDAGYAPSGAAAKASHIVNSPEGKKALADCLDEAGLSDKRIASELDRGLRVARPDGKHGDYLDRLLNLRGHTTKADKEAPSVNLFLGFAAQLQSGGIIEADNSVTKINEAQEDK